MTPGATTSDGLAYRIESDRPIIAYCGGGTCEISMGVADALIARGHRKVLVFMGGFPEWEAAGYPVVRGEGPY